MEGHVTDGHKFNPVTSLSNTDTDYNKNPTEDDKVHLLVCVISANATEIKESVLQKMNSVRETACDLGIPQIAILTKIDEACPETEKDLKKLYKSKHLSKKMKYFSSATGIPQKCIFLVKNYSNECEPNEDVDTLILAALRKMIEFGDDFIEHMKYQVDKNWSFTEMLWARVQKYLLEKGGGYKWKRKYILADHKQLQLFSNVMKILKFDVLSILLQCSYG